MFIIWKLFYIPTPKISWLCIIKYSTLKISIQQIFNKVNDYQMKIYQNKNLNNNNTSMNWV